MQVKRSTKCSLKFSSQAKLDILANKILPEYGRVVNFFISLETPNKASLLAPIANQPVSWLSSRLKKVAAREAIDMILSAKNKENPEARKHRPHHYGRSMQVSSTIASLKTSKTATAFDSWLHLASLGEGIVLDLPIKLHKHFHRLAARGKRLESYVIHADYAQLCFEIETGKKKTSGLDAGLDTGIKALATLNNGHQYGLDIEALVEKIKRKKPGSHQQQRARRALRQRMDEIAKELIASEDLKTLVVEDLKKLNYQTKLKRRLSRSMRRSLGTWAYRYWLHRIQMATEDNRISLRCIPPAYTSQRCYGCGHTERANRNGKMFWCLSCGHKDNADVNAAKNILFRWASGPYGAAYQPTMKPKVNLDVV